MSSSPPTGGTSTTWTPSASSSRRSPIRSWATPPITRDPKVWRGRDGYHLVLGTTVHREGRPSHLPQRRPCYLGARRHGRARRSRLDVGVPRLVRGRRYRRPHGLPHGPARRRRGAHRHGHLHARGLRRGHLPHGACRQLPVLRLRPRSLRAQSALDARGAAPSSPGCACPPRWRLPRALGAG